MQNVTLIGIDLGKHLTCLDTFGPDEPGRMPFNEESGCHGARISSWRPQLWGNLASNWPPPESDPSSQSTKVA